MANKSLSQAKDAKNDEFYTQLSEIQAEIANYAGNPATGETNKFEGKVVFCNCDDPFESNFVKYFLMNFNRLKLKELIATGYKTSPIGGTDIGSKGEPYALRVTSTTKYLVGTQKDLDVKGAKYFLSVEGDRVMTPLIGNPAIDEDGKQIVEEIKEPVVDADGNSVLDKKGNPKYKKVKHEVYYEAGDFRSDMCIELLKQSDIVCTNPPFSLFREYIAVLMKYKKDFLILGNPNAITYKEFFPLLKDNKVWIGNKSMSRDMYFIVSEEFKKWLLKNKKEGSGYVLIKGEVYGRASAIWYTNLDHAKRHIKLPLDLGFTYYGHEDMYPKYDNYDAINVDKVSEIPCDYEPCWYKCPHATSCKYAQSEGKEDKALCEQSCNGEIGVPISFVDKHSPEQFEIIGCDTDLAKKEDLGDGKIGTGRFYLNQTQEEIEASKQASKQATPLQSNCHSQVAVSATELSESQSRSSTNIVQSNLELSDSIDMSKTTQNQDIGLHSHPKKHMPEFSYKKCNGILGVPITFLEKLNPNQFMLIDCTHTTSPELWSGNHPISYYKDFKRGKVVTNADASMPLMATDVCGGTKCVRDADGAVIYQLYHRLFIRKIKNDVSEIDEEF